MDCRIIVDSCCDLSQEMRKEMGVITAPMSVILGEKSYIDDDNVDIHALMQDMKIIKGKFGSIAPSPWLYADALNHERAQYVVTVSGNLSGSYLNAMMGKEMTNKCADPHVFDSKSASAGEALVALKLYRAIKSGLERSQIISSLEKFIKEMKTLFVLENTNNLMKSGRLNKIVGKVVTVLNIKPIMGSDGDGNIMLFAKARGQNQILEKLSGLIKDSGRKTEGESMVISHCQNPDLAEKLKLAFKESFRFAEIIITQTRGLTSMLADEMGVVLAF